LKSHFKFESTQENPNKIQIKIHLITLTNYRPKIIGGAKLNLGILGEKHQVILMCCMSTSNTNQVLEISHFAIKPILRMLHTAPRFFALCPAARCRRQLSWSPAQNLHATVLQSYRFLISLPWSSICTNQSIHFHLLRRFKSQSITLAFPFIFNLVDI
jgi:hypothetical protein